MTEIHPIYNILDIDRDNTVQYEGELIYTRDTKKCFIGDGTTPGGISLNQTANELLIALKTVDGPVSGLDIDLVDGLEGSQLIRNDQDGFINGTLDLNDEVLSSISALTANANNVVDVFLYDTTKDSDGGAWRKRTSHTSWYNETLNTSIRGSTKEFPSLALIIIESNAVTIYDMTDSSCPMWMVFNNGTLWNSALIVGSVNSGVDMRDGLLVVSHVGNAQGVIKINFISDNSYSHTSNLNFGGNDLLGIVDRNNSGHTYANNETRSDINLDTILVNNTVNDVAITILPNAPVDTETNLPIPTIATATGGGVSIIHNDITITNIIHTDLATTLDVFFDSDNALWYNANGFLHKRSTLPTLNEQSFVRYVKGNSDTYYSSYYLPSTYLDADGTVANSSTTQYTITSLENQSIGSDNGLTLYKENDNNLDLINFIDKDYQSGWNTLETKGVFLANSKVLNRSVNTKILVEFGTIVESSVETGAELKAYSGFSATNYLYQLHNDDLNFGAGDFYINVWIKISNTGTSGYVCFRGTTPTSRLGLVIGTSGEVSWQHVTTDASGHTLLLNDWTMLSVIRENGIINIYKDGIPGNIITDNGVKDETNDNFTIGSSASGTSPLIYGSLSLFRIGADAPSEDQIKEIYESEKLLFQENVECTLSSASNSNVNALSYDKDSQELYVGGTDNLDTFKGLVRTKSETGVYTSLSSSNSVIAKGN